MEKTKTCSLCGVPGSPEDFHIRDRVTGKRRDDCKSCVRQRVATYRLANPAKTSDCQRDWYRRNAHATKQRVSRNRRINIDYYRQYDRARHLTARRQQQNAESIARGPLFTCEECGTQQHTKRCLDGKTRFCSQSCKAIYELKHNRRTVTSIERLTYEALSVMGISYSSQHGIERMVVDAFLPDSGLVIECLGDYFHCNPVCYPQGPINKMQERMIARDAWRKQRLTELGYAVMELWESDIKTVGAMALIEPTLAGLVRRAIPRVPTLTRP